MIIGEHNLVIGKISVIISDFSSSLYSAFENTKNYLIKKLKKIIFSINPKTNDPPLNYF